MLSAPICTPFGIAPIQKTPGKKTVVVKKIDKRAPDGRLLSSTLMETVYYGEVPVDEFIRGPIIKVAPGKCSQICKCSSPETCQCSSLGSESSRASSRSSKSTSTKSTSICQCPPSLCKCSNFTRNHHEADRISMASSKESHKTEVVDHRPLGNSTLYGDDWSQNGTLLKESRLVRSISMLSLQSLAPDLVMLIERMNDYRRSYGVPEFILDDFLIKEAKDWAFQMVFDRKIREKEHTEMNLWVGPRVTDEIVDEWDEEMQYWSVHHYMSPRYNYVGVGKAWNHRNSCFVVVAMYF